MLTRIAAVCAAGALASAASAGITSLNFTTNPTIEGGTGMSVLGNGAVLGPAIDNNDSVRYANVGFANGQFFDAVMTVVDAQNRTAIAFAGGGTTIDSQFNTVNDAVINLSNAGGGLDPDTGLENIAGPSDQFQRTSALIRMDFFITGTTTPVTPNIDIGLTFFDIDGATSGANRGRMDGITLFDTDGIGLANDTVLTTDTSVPGAATFMSSLGQMQSPANEQFRYAVTGFWNDVNSIEFEWFFDWSANGVRGVNFSGNFLIPSPGAAVMMGFAGLAATRRRRSA